MERLVLILALASLEAYCIDIHWAGLFSDRLRWCCDISIFSLIVAWMRHQYWNRWGISVVLNDDDASYYRQYNNNLLSSPSPTNFDHNELGGISIRILSWLCRSMAMLPFFNVTIPIHHGRQRRQHWNRYGFSVMLINDDSIRQLWYCFP